MLSILADVLMIATGRRPNHTHATRHPDADWNDRFLSSRMQGLDVQSRRTNARCDLNW